MTSLRLSEVVLDCPEPRALAEFYRLLLGWPYAPGHEDDDPEGDEWLVLVDPAGGPRLAFNASPEHRAPTWPGGERPMTLHLDIAVNDLDAEHDRVKALGAVFLRDHADVPEEPDDRFRVYADPAGHPFCLVLAPPS